MSTSLMIRSQESSLPAGAALRLPAHAAGYRLRVIEGQVWLTQSALADDEIPADHWLTTGQSLVVGPDSDAVLEGWPSARVELQPLVSASRAAIELSALRRWLQRLRARTSVAPAPCAS